MCAIRKSVWKVREAGPDSFKHDLQALASLEALCTEPEYSDHTTHKDGEVGSPHAKTCTGKDGKVDTKHGTHPTIQHSRYADEDMADQDCENGQARVQTFTDRAGGHLVHGNGECFGYPKT